MCVRYRYFALFFIALVFVDPIQAQTQVTLPAVKDNTLYESAGGSLSNGTGEYFFAGKTASGSIRRAVLAFDISGIPAGAEIQSAAVTLNLSKEPTGGIAVSASLHRITADWGEGTSNASAEEGGGAQAATSDATWIHRFFNTDTWQQAGGDFAAVSSASAEINAPGSYTWGSTENMTTDVQAWVDDPGTNFGWILIGNESANATAKRFDSSENAAAANRPTLQVTYATGVAVEEIVPTVLRLGDNFPDPFHSISVVPFELDAPAHVRIQVYDVLGRSVKTLVDRTLLAGPHQVDVSSAGMTSGLYAYCFQNDTGRQCRTMVVTR